VTQWEDKPLAIAAVLIFFIACTMIGILLSAVFFGSPR